MNFLDKKSQLTLNQLTVQIQELQDQVNSLNDSRDFCDPETASSCGVISRAQSSCDRSESLAAILACSLTHGTYMAHRETFLNIHLHQANQQHLVLEMCMQEVSQLHIANL